MIKDKEWLKEELRKIASRRFGADLETDNEIGLVVDEIDEPEKVVIPQMIGEYIEKEAGKNTLGNIAEEIYNNSTSWSRLTRLQRWLRLNFTLFAKAWITGNYTIEQEKRYRVKVGEKLYFFGYNEMVAEFVIEDAPGSADGAKIFYDIEDANKCAREVGGMRVEVTE